MSEQKDKNIVRIDGLVTFCDVTGQLGDDYSAEMVMGVFGKGRDGKREVRYYPVTVVGKGATVSRYSDMAPLAEKAVDTPSAYRDLRMKVTGSLVGSGSDMHVLALDRGVSRSASETPSASVSISGSVSRVLSHTDRYVTVNVAAGEGTEVPVILDRSDLGAEWDDIVAGRVMKGHRVAVSGRLDRDRYVGQGSSVDLFSVRAASFRDLSLEKKVERKASRTKGVPM